MGFFTDAYDLFIIGVVIFPLTPLWHLNALEISLLGSTALIAAALGSLVFGHLADLLGRKVIYGYELLVLAAGAILSALSPNILLWNDCFGSPGAEISEVSGNHSARRRKTRRGVGRERRRKRYIRAIYAAGMTKRLAAFFPFPCHVLSRLALFKTGCANQRLIGKCSSGIIGSRCAGCLIVADFKHLLCSSRQQFLPRWRRRHLWAGF
jgi:MFS family permease